jgi:hypothetical protein
MKLKGEIVTVFNVINLNTCVQLAFWSKMQFFLCVFYFTFGPFYALLGPQLATGTTLLSPFFLTVE